MKKLLIKGIMIMYLYISIGSLILYGLLTSTTLSK